ncbi:MAG: hypothetical protein JST00_25605 [Deltaproteobacteria bacterium]|nr:hypothetical protein [Deltaproteobacteria bacterium]
MRSCPWVESVEELALGKVGGSSAEALRSHLGECDACALAFVELEEERALFVRRAASAPPPPPLVLPVEARAIDVLGAARRAMGGHSTLAAAAAILAFVGATRLGATSRIASSPTSTDAATGSADAIAADGPLASFRPREPLSCAKDEASAACAVSTSALAIAEPNADGAPCESDDLLMSRAGAATCELAVTSSTSRQ